MENCIFCQIAGGELPCQKEYEDEEFLAFRDIRPATPVHVLVIPKQHVMANLGEMTEEQVEVMGKLQWVAKLVADKLGIGNNFSLKTNTGREAGQSVWHLHYHLQGGWKGGED